MKKIYTFFLAIPLFLSTTPTFASTHCLSNQALPDHTCTPGAILTTDALIVCVSGYTKTVRNVSTAVKKMVFKEYAIPWSLHSNYEVDHLISLELGGSNDVSNLWPESYLIKDGSRTKDTFENYLHRQVCGGKLSLVEAQKEIKGGWREYYREWKHLN
ncbi:MAG: hypothetical protein RLZZ347_205 [Candidatus Parcubacteria bacterium]|jgi:hypothetical protein